MVGYATGQARLLVGDLLGLTHSIWVAVGVWAGSPGGIAMGSVPWTGKI
jgi:hypothetical protein